MSAAANPLAEQVPYGEGRERFEQVLGFLGSREALEMRKRLFPGDYPEVPVALNNLAVLLSDRGDLAGAEPLFREALAMTKRLFPGDHPSVATYLQNMAGLLEDRG